MLKRYLKLISIFAGMAFTASPCAFAGKGTVITLPKRSRLTPVQRLNRDGVEAVKRHAYDKAEQLFYRAYLYDPADPFTLNNLGYVAELEGQLDRAHKFYELAAEQGSDANIDLSNTKHLQGQPMKSALVDLKDVPMRVNRMNIDGMRLLAQNRGFEAIALLKQTLALDEGNPFTLNNLGVASEAIGDLQSALRYYTAAAQAHSKEPTVVALDKSWRGKPVSSMAQASAKRVQRLVERSDPGEASAVMYTVRGVYAANQNDWPAAREAFLHAYALAPNSAFSLNNRGYVAEHEGDLETAQFFYEKARRAENAGAPVGLATDLDAQGKRLSVIAGGSNEKVDTALEAYSRRRRGQPAPVELTPRGSSDQPAENSDKPE